MRKLLTYSVVIATIVWSLGLAAVVPASAAYSPQHGDYIKTATDTAVYYIDADGDRRLFSNLVTFRSWDNTSWGDLVDSGQLQIISQDDFDALSVGDNVTVRPGVNLIQFDNSLKTYAVLPGGELSYITSSTAAEALYGADWASKVITIQSSFETNYTKTGADLDENSDLPDGSLVKYEGSDDVYYIENGEKRMVTDEAFVANGLWDSAVITIGASMTYTTGSSITSEEAAISTVDGVMASTSAGDGTLTVSLSASTPATTTLLSNQARAVFTVVDLTNGSDSDVTVDSITIERAGLGADSSFSTVAAYLNSVTGTQVGLNKTLNSDHKATIGDDFVVPAGTTKKLYLTGNMGTVGAGNAPRLDLSAIAVKGGASLNASLPVSGNTMALNANIAIATVKVGPGASNPSTNSAPKVGDSNVNIAQIKIENASPTEEVQVEKIVVKQEGTISDGDVENYQLIDSSDSTVLATASQVDKYVEFTFATPFNIGKSKTKNFMVRTGEILSGSARTIQFDVYRNTDVVVKTLSYNTYRIPDFYSDSSLTSAVTSQPYINNTTDQTVGNGTLKVEASNAFASGNIAENQTGVQLGEWLFTVKGEGVDITNIESLLTIGGTSTGTPADITNCIFFDVDSGNALTGAVDATGGDGNSGGVTSTDTISLDVGVHKIGIKCNLNGDFAANDTIKWGIDPDSDIDTTGQVTGNSITESPTSFVDSATLTVKIASLNVSVSPNPAAANIIRGETVEAARIVLDASGSGDDITVTQLTTATRTTTMTPDELSNLRLYDGDTELTVTSDADPTSATAGAVTTTWPLSQPLVITAGSVKTLSIELVTSGSTDANDKFTLGFQGGNTVTAKDSQGDDVTPGYSYSDGQEMTIQTVGTLTITRSDTYRNSHLIGNTTGVAVGKFSASAIYGDVNIQEVYLDMANYGAGSGTTDELTGIYLYNGATQIAEATITASDHSAVLFNMTSDPLVITPGVTTELTVKVDTGVIANDGTATIASAAAGFTPSIRSTSVVAKTGGNDATVTTATVTFPNYLIVKSKPTVSIASTGDSITSNGEYDLINVSVTADSKGPIGLYKMTFRVSTTTVDDGNSYTFFEGSTQVSSVSATDTKGINVDTRDGHELVEVFFNVGSYGTTVGSELRTIAAGEIKTYTLKATVTGYTSNVSNGISTSMTGDAAITTSDYVAADTVNALDDNDFIWSDLSYGNTSSTATKTLQWMNGFLLDSAGDFTATTSSAKSI